MNKKGVNFSIDSMPFYIVFLIVLGVMFIVFIAVTRASTSNFYVYPDGVEEYIASSRFPNCLLTQYYPGAIDWNTFEQELDSCYNIRVESGYYAYRFRLEFANEIKTAVTSNWNDEVSSRARRFQVPVLRNEAVQDGILIIEVQNE